MAALQFMAYNLPTNHGPTWQNRTTFLRRTETLFGLAFSYATEAVLLTGCALVMVLGTLLRP